MKQDLKCWNDSLRVEVWKWSKSWSGKMTVWELKCESEARIEVVNDSLRVEVRKWSKSWSGKMTVWELKWENKQGLKW